MLRLKVTSGEVPAWLSLLPVLKLRLAIKIEILEWPSPSCFGVAVAMTPVNSVA